MLQVNRVTLLGHAGRDAEAHTGKSGDKSASFSLATTRRWKGQDGAPAESTEWHRIVVFGGFVKPALELVQKGAALLVEGRLATREYTDKQGIKRQVTEVIVAGPQSMLNALSRKPATDGAGEAAEPEPAGGDEA